MWTLQPEAALGQGGSGSSLNRARSGLSQLGLASVRLGLGLASVRLGLKFTGGLYDASDYKSTEANTKM